MQPSFLVTSLMPASTGGSNAGMNASQGASGIGNTASSQSRDRTTAQPSFSSLLDHASQSEAATPNRPAAVTASSKPSCPQNTRAAGNASKHTHPEGEESEDRTEPTSARSEEVGNEKTSEGAASSLEGAAPEMAQLLNQLMTGNVRPPADRAPAAEPTSLTAKNQAEVQAAAKSVPRGLAGAVELRTGEALSGGAALRKSMPHSGEADPSIASDPTRALGASPSEEDAKVEVAGAPKVGELRPQSAQTAAPQIAGNLLAPGAGAGGPSTAMNTSITPTASDSAIPYGPHQTEFIPAFSARIATLVRDGVEQARLHLNPAEMGPVALKLSLDGQQVRVDMTAELAATRQVLEQSMPTLAGALRDAGFTLAGGGVFQPGDESSGRPRTGPGGSDAGTGLPGQEGSGTWNSAAGQSSDGRRPQDQAAGTIMRMRTEPSIDSQGNLTDDTMNLHLQADADGTLRWPTGTRLLDMFA